MIGSLVRNIAWDDVREGDRLPEIVLPITYLRAASHPAATRDYFPGHHDPSYARLQGQPDIYVNTMFLHGMLDRLVLDWAGPSWFISRRRMAMLTSIYVNETIVAQGAVTTKFLSEDGVPTLTIESRITASERLCVTGETDILLPQSR